VNEEQLIELTHAVQSVAESVTHQASGAGRDVNGGSVSSLTEAVMGISFGLARMADALESIAAAIRESGNDKK